MWLAAVCMPEWMTIMVCVGLVSVAWFSAVARQQGECLSTLQHRVSEAVSCDERQTAVSFKAASYWLLSHLCLIWPKLLNKLKWSDSLVKSYLIVCTLFSCNLYSQWPIGGTKTREAFAPHQRYVLTDFVKGTTRNHHLQVSDAVCGLWNTHTHTTRWPNSGSGCFDINNVFPSTHVKGHQLQHWAVSTETVSNTHTHTTPQRKNRNNKSFCVSCS